MADDLRRVAGARPAPPPRALGWITVGALFALMTLGNVVSATGSGLACPDWPLCHGRLIPPLTPHVLVEYGHRLAAVITSVLLVATIVSSFRRATGRRLRRLGLALLALLAVQIALGGITVLLKLPHLVSTAHLVNALLILAGVLALCAPTAEGQERTLPGASAKGNAQSTRAIRRLTGVGLAVLLLQLALGGYVRHSGAGLACPDFPLCAGALFPDRWFAVAHWLHRWLGVALLGLFAHLALASRRTVAGRAAGLALGLAVAQVTLGILTVLLQLAPPIRATHAVVGYALWAVFVWTALCARSPHAPDLDRPVEGSRNARAEPVPDAAHVS